MQNFGGHESDFTELIQAFRARGIYLLVCGGTCTDESIERRVKELPQPVAIVLATDSSRTLNCPAIHVYRFSLEQHGPDTVFPMYWVVMPHLSPCPKLARPRVSFRGCITHPSRAKGLSILYNSPLLDCLIDVRPHFWDGSVGNAKSHTDFVHNMEAGHFAYCPRGAGNFSIRFYEALKAGRIPVVPTSISLPFPHKIPWKEYIVLCDTEEDMPTKICEFWSSSNVEERQTACAELFKREFQNNLAENMMEEISTLALTLKN